MYLYARKILQILKNKGLIAAVVGGYDLQTREHCAKYLSDFPVLGYLIDGLFLDGKTVHEIPYERVEDVISHTLVRTYGHCRAKKFLCHYVI